MGHLQGKVAIVTGAGRGIGRAVALRLAADGAAVVVNDFDPVPADDVVAAIVAAGGRAVSCNGDVTKADFGDRFVQAALDAFGGLDIIVNNAGYTRDGVIQKQTDEQFQSMLDIHVTAPFRILRAAADHFRAVAAADAAGGLEVIRKVVNVSSMAGTHGNAGQVNYSSAKAAVVGMTKTLSKEWGRYKVCVNCVAFGFIDTRLTASIGDRSASLNVAGTVIRAGVPAAMREALPKLVPLGRAGSPEEAAGAVAFFCSPDSDYVSGETLVVGGGISF